MSICLLGDRRHTHPCAAGHGWVRLLRPEPALMTVGGEIDLHTLGHLRAAVRQLEGGTARPGRVAIVDVSDVTFADLSAVALLAALAAARQIVGGRLLLAGANQALISLLATTGVLEQIDTLG